MTRRQKYVQGGSVSDMVRLLAKEEARPEPPPPRRTPRAAGIVIAIVVVVLVFAALGFLVS